MARVLGTVGIAVGLIIFALFWASRSYVYQDHPGQAVLINRFTGRVVRLDSLLLPPAPLPTRPKRTWEAIELPTSGGSAKAMLETKWSDGKLRYLLALMPATDQIKKARDNPLASYTVLFQDSDGFPIATDTIPVAKLVEESNNADKEEGFDYFGTLAMNVHTYDSIRGWNIEWALGK